MKYRDDCVNGSEYTHFVDDFLGRNLGLAVKRLDGDFGGQAWLVKDNRQNRAILVEHETGLEILGAIGSVASLIALLPLISSAWTSLRDRFSRHRFDHSGHADVEIRRFDQNNTLIEEHAPTVEAYVLNMTLQDHSALKQKVSKLETEVERLKKALPARRKSRSRKSKPTKR
ncbi:MAG: hypothetical protein WC740_11565 [Verrucomicrobiia bacterium]